MIKKQIIIENILPNTFNMLNEGGIFHINDINSDQMQATYEYLDDINPENNTYQIDPNYIYLSYDNPEIFTPHPKDPNWVKIPDEFGFLKKSPAAKIGDRGLETLDNENPRPVNKDSRNEMVVGYGGYFYMPKLQKIDKGDNIEMRKTSFKMRNGEYIPCYNLSLLGKTSNKTEPGMSVPTMMAHFWKGKLLNFKRKSKVTIAAKGTASNVIKYLNNMVKLAKDTPELAGFNPDYIVFPQSSSSFNDAIAKRLKRYIFPNATILANGTIPKLKTWETDFSSLVSLTIDDTTKKGGTAYSKYATYSGYNQVWGQYYIQQTILSRAKESIKTYILSKIKEDLGSQIKNNLYGKKGTQEKIWGKIVSCFNTEFEKLSKALKEYNIEIPSRDEYFLTVCWDTLRGGFFDWKQPYKKDNNLKISTFSDVDTLEKMVRKGVIYVDTNKLDSEKVQKNTSIKEFDVIQRLALDKQFDLKPQNNKDGSPQMTKQASEAKVVIIDDNYATGASLRNSAQVLIDNGFLAKNIITLTPGDMGGAYQGGKQGASIPHQNAEADLVHKIVNGRIEGYDTIDPEVMAGFRKNHAAWDKSDETTSNAHKARNQMHDMWYNQKQPQQYRQAENRKLNMNDIHYIIAEAIKRLK